LVHAVELVHVRIPFARPFVAATSATNVKDALLVHVVTDLGDGWGECVAQVHPTYLPDTITSSRAVLRSEIAPRVFAGAPLTDIVGNAPARAAMECALLDARLQAEGRSLASWLGATRTRVAAGAAIGIGDDATLRASVADAVAAGYRRIKCKVVPDRAPDIMRTARDVLGERSEIALAADANGTFPYDAIGAVAGLDAFDLQCIEQPFGVDEIDAHARLSPEMRAPVCLDETITSAAITRHAIGLGACGAVSIKPGRLGGIAESRAVYDSCLAAEVPMLIGGMLETGIGRAVLVALAALDGFTMVGDCAASAHYFGPDGDLTTPFELEDGYLRVPTAPGLGVDVIPDRLAQVTIAREILRAKDIS
jgi:O-succinylbenzoate synthase